MESTTSSATRPLVSVVTPFYNSASTLDECIRSVLAQTHARIEYILLDNASTDGSSDIARRYAAADARIRYVRNPELLPQVANYNRALELIGDDSVYCKVVQADDWIFPDCVRALVDAFAQSERIGIAGSYFLRGTLVRGYGLEVSATQVPGREVVRRLLRDALYVFGSPSAHMYRSTIVRAYRPFWEEGRLHEDTDRCIDILAEWDYGFVPQVLSFLRVDAGSISGRSRLHGGKYLDRYLTVRRYAGQFFDAREAERLRADVKRFYYGFLAGSALKLRRGAFWNYHRDGLRTIGETLDRPYLVRQIVRRLAWWTINPGQALAVLRRAPNAVDIPD